MSDLNASIGIDFSLIGTKLHAAYEKRGEDGYAILLMPAAQEAESGVSIGEVIKDIQKLAGGGQQADTKQLTDQLTDSLSSVSESQGKGKFSLDNIIVKLSMAYLYLRKGCKNQADEVTEYAFWLQIVTEGFLPREVAALVDVTNVSLCVWNTTRKTVVDQMQLVTINDYLGIPKESDTKEETGGRK